jgi:AcrR family transcriptional regulator
MATEKTVKRVRASYLGPERRRPQILDSALDLVVDQGTRAVTMEVMAKRLGVTKPVVYACFSTREELLLALLEREEQKLLAGAMATLPSGLNAEGSEQAVIAGLQAMFRLVETHTASWQLVFMAHPDSMVAERYGVARRMVKKRIKDLMKARLTGNTPDVDRKLPLLVNFFMATAESAVQTVARNKGDWGVDELATFVAHFILGGIRSALASNKTEGKRPA